MPIDERTSRNAGGDHPAAERGDPSGRGGAGRLPPLIMLVDDDASIRSVLTRMLKDHGCRVIPCRDAIEALDALDAIVPDLIISDLDMPFVDGVEFYRRCRAVSGLSGIPFVIISGAADVEEKLRDVREELTGVYPKPVALETLLKIVDMTLDAPSA